MSQKGNAVSKRQRESENEHDMLSSSLALLLFISFHCCCVYFAFSVVPAFNATVCVSNLKLCEQESNNSPRMAVWQNAHRSSNKQQGSRSSTTGFLEASEDAFVHEKPPPVLVQRRRQGERNWKQQRLDHSIGEIHTCYTYLLATKKWFLNIEQHKISPYSFLSCLS